MPSIRCTHCDARLKLPEGFSGSSVKCPKCGGKIESEPATQVMPSASTETTSSVAATPTGAPAVPTDNEIDPDTATETNFDSQSVAKATRAATRGISNGGLFDFQFKKYWTPWVIRVSWFAVLILSALWGVFLTVGFVAFLFAGQKLSLTDSFGVPDISSMSSLDLNGILNGRADVDGLNKFLDEVGQPGGTSAKPTKPRSTYQSSMAFAFSFLSFLTLIATSVLSVLFCRVFFEVIVVVFDIAKTLKNIESNQQASHQQT